MDKGLVSIIITTKNEQEVIERLLKSIKKQTYSDIETIVVDNDSQDKTKQIAKKFTDKVFDKGPERSAQRNFGAKKAKGDYYLFLDADMQLSSKVVEACVNKIDKKKKIEAATILEESVAEKFWEKVKAFERSFYNLEGDKLTDAARFFTKKTFKDVGGYDETITGPEDWDLTEKVRKYGFKIAVVKEKIKHYESVSSLPSLLKKKYYYGLRSYRYLEKQKVPLIGPKTIYFFRPVFYKNAKKLISNPIMSLAMFFMLTLELVAGGLGFLVGKVNNL